MSLHISIISIEGDARNSLDELFSKCEYASPTPPEVVEDWDALLSAFDSPEAKAAVFHESRTTIIDPELVMMHDDEVLTQMSSDFGPVLSMICEGVSGTYGFSVFKNGEKMRSLLSVDGEIVDSYGAPLPEEGDASDDELSEGRVVEILQKLGFSYESLTKANEYILYHLEFAGEDEVEDQTKDLPELKEKKKKKSKKTKTKPWWKFW